MLEAEINPSGEVTVEGHHVGALQGFRFTADQSAGGEDAKAVKAAAQKALAQEFDTRAERFAIASNGDFGLASDGLLRWIGAPVATLTAGEDALAPRTILLADEQLTGPARDKVAARVERYVAYQIDTLLKPLKDLRDAEQLSGIARGIAFRLVENFGLLNRRDVADEVKSLDQEARAALRRLGVRFGAFHIFIPALLKPAPAGLVTLLWALKNDGKDKPGFGDVVNALASGRTSLVVDTGFEPEFYRLAGYRVLGRRAVRVDILERLADLIRPALAWRAGTGVRPDGAFDGAAFIVTPAMMSILGATAEDMEEILKALGYRAEPKPAAEVQAKLDALDAAEREAVARRAAEAEHAKIAQAKAAEAASAQTGIEGDPTPTEAIDTPAGAVQDEVAVAETSQHEIAAADVAGADESEPAEPTPSVVADAAEAQTPVAVDPTIFESAEAEVPAQEGEPQEAPKPILLWRPARFEGRRDHGKRHGRGGAQHGKGPRRDGVEADGKGGRERFDRRFKGKPGDSRKGDGDGRPERDRRNDRGKPREERPTRIDPDSPFAKLAALRDQLKK